MPRHTRYKPAMNGADDKGAKKPLPRHERRGRTRRLLRIYAVFLRGFLRELFDARLEHYAASLSWSTIFSLVPLTALLIGLFTTLPAFERLLTAAKQLIHENLPVTDPQVVIGHIDRFVANAHQLGWIGAAWMLIALYLFVRTYDFIVQDIAGAKERAIPRAIGLYSLLVLAKLVLAAGAFALQARLSQWLGAGRAEWLAHLLVSFALIWAIFWLFYQFSPNRRIAPATAATSAFIAAVVWEISRRLFLLYIGFSPTYQTIYGSVTTLIVVLLWIYISWAIFIYGLKFCILLQRGDPPRA